MTSLETIQQYAELASTLIVVLGVPVAIFNYWWAKRKEQRDREYGTYDALDEKYLEFENICLHFPELDIFDIADKNPKPLNAIQQKQELVAFTILFSIFERAFVMYYGQSSKIRMQQWRGWEEFIGEYCARANFQAAWQGSGRSFDSEFQAYMNSRLKKEVARSGIRTTPVRRPAHASRDGRKIPQAPRPRH